MNQPILYIFSGLLGSGKTTLAQELSKVISGVYIRIDTVEQGIRDLCDFRVEGEGYHLSYRVAADNLRLGKCVVADSCNPIELTRRKWAHVAIDSGANFLNIEIACTDRAEHKHRIETRKTTIPGLKLPNWDQVEGREYHSWDEERVVIDTANKSISMCSGEPMQSLQEAKTPLTNQANRMQQSCTPS